MLTEAVKTWLKKELCLCGLLTKTCHRHFNTSGNSFNLQKRAEFVSLKLSRQPLCRDRKDRIKKPKAGCHSITAIIQKDRLLTPLTLSNFKAADLSICHTCAKLKVIKGSCDFPCNSYAAMLLQVSLLIYSRSASIKKEAQKLNYTG